jgi:non-ribosomal peptide synthetase component F
MRVPNNAAEIVPWQFRDKTPDAVKNLPTAVAEPEVSDERSAEYSRWALEQSELARQKELEAQIDPALNAEEIRVLYEQELAAENARTAEQRAYESARTFTAECGTYIQTPQNAKRIADWLEAAGLDGTSTDHYHKAYGELSAAGLLRVKPTPAQPRRALTPQDLYSMPLEDLRKLAEHDESQTQTRLVVRR